MNQDALLKEILNNKKLRDSYWPDLQDIDSINVNTLLRKSNELNNSYLKLLHILITNVKSSTTRINQQIAQLF